MERSTATRTQDGRQHVSNRVTFEVPDAGASHMSMYESVVVRLCVNDVECTNNPLRPVHSEHPAVEEFRNMFLQGLYGVGNEMISVCFLNLRPQHTTELIQVLRTTTAKNSTNNKEAVCNLSHLDWLPDKHMATMAASPIHLVDGAHRLFALKDAAVQQKVPFPVARLFYRKDMKPFSRLDCFKLGSVLNEASSTAVKMSTTDKIHLVTSLLRTVQSANASKAHGVGEMELVKKIQASMPDPLAKDVLRLISAEKIFCAQSETHVLKYCTVACGLFRMQTMWKSGFDTLSKFTNLRWYSSPRVWTTPSPAQQHFLLLVLVKTAGKLKDSDGAMSKGSVVLTDNVDSPYETITIERLTGNLSTRVVDMLYQVLRLFHSKGITDEARALEYKVLKSAFTSTKITLREALNAWIESNPLHILASDFTRRKWTCRLSQFKSFLESTTQWPGTVSTQEDWLKTQASGNTLRASQNVQLSQPVVQGPVHIQHEEAPGSTNALVPFSQQGVLNVPEQGNIGVTQETPTPHNDPAVEPVLPPVCPPVSLSIDYAQPICDSSEEDENPTPLSAPTKDNDSVVVQEKSTTKAVVSLETVEDTGNSVMEVSREGPRKSVEQVSPHTLASPEGGEQVHSKLSAIAVEGEGAVSTLQVSRIAREKSKAGHKTTNPPSSRVVQPTPEPLPERAGGTTGPPFQIAPFRKTTSVSSKDFDTSQSQVPSLLKVHGDKQGTTAPSPKENRGDKGCTSISPSLPESIPPATPVEPSPAVPDTSRCKRVLEYSQDEVEENEQSIESVPTVKAPNKKSRKEQRKKDTVRRGLRVPPLPKLSERMDSNGFRITRRWEHGFAWEKPLRASTAGLTNVMPIVRMFGENKEVHVDTISASIPNGDSENTTVDVVLLPDYMGCSTPLNPSWKMDEEPTTEDTLEFNFVRELPSYADRAIMPLMSAQKILRLLGFHPPHRSHFTLGFEDLVVLRRFVHSSLMRDHSALGRLMNLGGESGELAARAMHAATVSCCRIRRAKLDSSGYTIFDRIVDLKNHPFDSWYSSPEGALGSEQTTLSVARVARCVHQFIRDYQSFLPTSDEEKTGIMRVGKQGKWVTSDNRALCSSRLRSRNVSMLHSTLESTTVDIEDGGCYSTIKNKCYVEVLFMMLCHYLRLQDSDFDGEPFRVTPSPLRVRDAGGSFVATRPMDPTENAHIDFYFNRSTVREKSNVGRNGIASHPAYSVFLTGDSTTPIWICESSHKWGLATAETLEKLANTAYTQLIPVPPFSVVIMRGDLIHANGGSLYPQTDWCLKYHMYVLRDLFYVAEKPNTRRIDFPNEPGYFINPDKYKECVRF